MSKKEQIINRLTEIRGKVIGECIEIDNLLTIRLTNYFFKRNCKQKTLFYWLILNTKKFGLEDKIQLFEKIDYFKKRKYYLEIKKSLRHVQKLRNKLAHWDLIINKSTAESIKLRDPLKLTDFTITPETIKEFERHKKDLFKFLLK